MTPSSFSFLQREFPLLHNLATSAEYHLYTDPVAALIRLRQFGEKLTEFVYDTHQLDGPVESGPSSSAPSFHNRIKALEEENIFQGNIASLVHNIKHRGNVAAHQVRGTVDDAKTILFSSFKLAKWFYQTYSEENSDITNLKFSPPPNLDARHALSELEKEYASLEAKLNVLLAEKDAKELTNVKAGHFEGDEPTLKNQVDRIITKLRRKKMWLKSAGEPFPNIRGGKDVAIYISNFKGLPVHAESIR